MFDSHMILMSYNIRLGIQQGLEPLARLINEAGAELVALQEVGDNWRMGPTGDTTATLGAMCALLHTHHVAALIEGEHRYGHALLSRHPILRTRQIALTQREDEPRVILHSTIAHPELGELEVVSTHLSWIADRDRQGEELLEVVRQVMTTGNPVFLMGDLNEHEPKPWLEALRELLDDADNTLKRLTFPSDAPRLRIDYVMASQGRWEAVDVLEEREASDHLPIVARWRLSQMIS